MENRFVFRAEWIDEFSGIIYKIKVTFYPENNAIELYNYRTKKQMLKRTIMKDIRQEDLQIGATLNIHSK